MEATTSQTQGESKVALITGIMGQVGHYLSNHLLGLGYQVHGLVRPLSRPSARQLDERIIQHCGDMTDFQSLWAAVSSSMPDEIYHLAAQSHVPTSHEVPLYTTDVQVMGTQRLLFVVKTLAATKKIKLLNACTSEMYGDGPDPVKTEETAFRPRSPYAVAKVAAFWSTHNARMTYGIFAVNAISFNHESPLRRPVFVTRKITLAVARISQGLQDVLELGNLDAERDWSHTSDIVKAMHAMLQCEEPEDFVLASGHTQSVRNFATMAFAHVGIAIEWQGEGNDEIGRDASGIVRVRVNPKFQRPLDVRRLQGGPERALQKLGWSAKITVQDLVAEMVDADLGEK